MYIKDVVRVWGFCELQFIEFSRVGTTNEWVFEFPTDTEEGSYVLEVFAEDKAGNIGHYASIVFTYDPTRMCVEVKQILYHKFIFVNHYCESAAFINQYHAHISRCEVCGRF